MSDLEMDVVGTGLYWVGGSIASVDTAVRGIIKDAQRELQLITYELRTDAKHVLESITAKLQLGVRTTVVVNRLSGKPAGVRSMLDNMVAEHGNFLLYDFQPPDEEEDLHAKILVADRESMVIGSANLSWRGLVRNHELGVHLRGGQVGSVSRAIDKLLRSPHAVRVR